MNNFFKSIARKEWLESDPAKDRTTGLIVFGTLEVALGLFCFTFAMLLLIAVSSAGLHGVKPVHFWAAQGLLFYLTGWFIVMGLGSMKAQRWARSLLLVGAWSAVFFGTLVLALILYILPDVYALVADTGLLPPMAALTVLYSAVLVLILLQVVFPLVCIVFYGLQSVQATCEQRHPDPCWTDRCPLPLLAMGFISVLGCFSLLIGTTTNFVVFVFGQVLSGLPGAGVLALVSIGSGYVGWGALTRRMHAWWGAYALVLLTSASMMLTFSEIDVDALYGHMGYRPEQIDALRSLYPLNPAMLIFLSCLWGIMACTYLVWVRDCFQPEKVVRSVKSYQQRKAEEAAAAAVSEPHRPRMRLD